tara:strand:- start:40 stop:237 length:198 start_codon:yes stop_codon:yes gene_type:complete
MIYLMNKKICSGCDQILNENIYVWYNAKIDDEVVICKQCRNRDEDELKQHGYKEVNKTLKSNHKR